MDNADWEEFQELETVVDLVEAAGAEYIEAAAGCRVAEG